MQEERLKQEKEEDEAALRLQGAYKIKKQREEGKKIT